MSDESLPICMACGTQFQKQKDGSDVNPSNCKICDDPRQYVPPTGQAWTTFKDLKQKHKNKIVQDDKDDRIWYIETTPRFAIGQRATYVQTPEGNILWDMIALLDDATKEFIQSKGGLKAIVISHPHYYTTHVEWATALKCPVYIADDDQEWLCRPADAQYPFKLIRGPVGATETIVPGVTAIKAGGHFPGSLLLHFDDVLLVADTIVTVPSAFTPYPRPPGQTTYSFMWSIPNMIPLDPTPIAAMWAALKPFHFTSTHAAFAGLDVRDHRLKERLLESMKIQVRNMGYRRHALLEEGEREKVEVGVGVGVEVGGGRAGCGVGGVAVLKGTRRSWE